MPVFPRKYASGDADREVLTFGGVEYDMGDAVAAGGGSVASPADVAIPASCALGPDGDVFLVQATSLEPPEG